MTFSEDCEFCGPATLYKDKEEFCGECGGRRKSNTCNEPTIKNKYD
jgi:hypothetical protein